MVQVINTEVIKCESCGEEHTSQLLAFPKTLVYKNQKLLSAEFYHTCPTNKVLIQTARDVSETFKAEKKLKNQIDKQIEMMYGAQNGNT